MPLSRDMTKGMAMQPETAVLLEGMDDIPEGQNDDGSIPPPSNGLFSCTTD